MDASKIISANLKKKICSLASGPHAPLARKTPRLVEQLRAATWERSPRTDADDQADPTLHHNAATCLRPIVWTVLKFGDLPTRIHHLAWPPAAPTAFEAALLTKRLALREVCDCTDSQRFVGMLEYPHFAPLTERY